MVLRRPPVGGLSPGEGSADLAARHHRHSDAGGFGSMMIAADDLVAEQFYWAKRRSGPDAEREFQIVRVSSIFGSTREFLTVATVGSEQHFALDEFDFFGVVPQFDGVAIPLSAGIAEVHPR